MKFLNTVFFFLLINNIAFGQTKMEIYTNPNIVWAGIVDIDIVIDADSSTDWKHYEISGLGGFLKQDSKALKKNEKALNAIFIEKASDIKVYQSDSLKYDYDYRYLNIYYEVENPEYYGYDLRTLPASEFDVFRLRSYIYYDKSTLNFEIQPLAVAILSSEDDTGNAINYKEIGWLPVAKWTKMMDINTKNITFAKRFYRDINFADVRVFKQEWMISEAMDDMLLNIRKQAERLELYDKNNFDGEKQMTTAAIKLLGMEEVLTFHPETFEEELVPVSVLSGDEIVGVRLSLDWIWNAEKELLHIHQQAFSPIFPVREDLGAIRFYDYLFIKNVAE